MYGDGAQKRDFACVDDIARGTIAGLKPVGYEMIHLGSGRPVAWMGTNRLIEELTGQPAKLEYQPPHPADVRAMWADISQAEHLQGGARR